MAFPYSIDFEGISDETTLTTSNTPFTSFSGTTPKADTARAHGGTVSMRFDGANGTEAAANLLDANATHVYIRLYLYLTANPSAQPLYFFNTTGATALDVRVNTAGTVALRTNGTLRATSTATVSLNQWVRFDIEIEGGVEAVVGIFNNPDSDTVTETISTTTSVTADVDSTRFGKTIGNALVLTGWMDDIAVQTTALPPVASTQSLTGTLFQKAPTFNAGTVTSTRNLAGTLFTKAPTFSAGSVTRGAVALTGTLFTKAPTFSAGAVIPDQPLTGTLFVEAPTFQTGALSATYGLTGTLFQNAPTFNAGSVASVFLLSGVLFTKAPSFSAGVVRFTLTQRPSAVASNDGWDTGPSPGGDIDAALVAEDSDFVTVTV